MEKIKINLLPFEFTKLQFEQSKFKKVQTICVTVILGITILALSVFGIRFLQSQDISKNQVSLKEKEQEIESLKNLETALTVLKNRITMVKTLTLSPSKERSIYNLVSSLTPTSIQISSMIVDRNANVSVSLTASNSTSLAEFLENLTLPEKNEDQITSVSIDSISRNRDGSLRASLKIKPK